MTNWQALASDSQYQAAQAVKRKILARDLDEAAVGIDELIESLGRSDKRALRSQLTRLMTHIIKWKVQPQRRTRSWVATIANARVEIASILDDEPSQRTNISLLWDKCLQAAKRIAAAETGLGIELNRLTETEVFEDEYILW